MVFTRYAGSIVAGGITLLLIWMPFRHLNHIQQLNYSHVPTAPLVKSFLVKAVCFEVVLAVFFGFCSWELYSTARAASQRIGNLR